jgi:prevent-host-death family protein
VAELRVTLGEILPVKEAARTLPRAIDQLERAEAEHFLITRRSRPSAVLVTVDRYQALLRAEAQLAA